ncbi:murein biosynthesis integral membrane protein MurJ [Candidatus Aerophobetes bacterium]|nr:murein biosynthesis integral membrane protein MurJ [Candidatus Aerophobetes bacterium]
MKKKGVVKAAGIVGLGTLFSRITGLIRLQVIAYLFGYSIATDAFWAAFTLPNLFRGLLAEGALTTAFIPVFSEWLSNKGEEEAWKLANNILNILFLFLIGVVGLGILLAPCYVPWIGVGFRNNPFQMHLAILLTQFMWPFLFFISIAALVMAVLNCRGHFASPAVAPLFFNVAIIICAFLFAKRWGIYSLALGVVIGGGLQLMVQVPYLIKKGFRYHFIISFKDEGVKKIGKLILPAILGGITLQINTVITIIFASILTPGSVSGLQYAMRLIQFPLGIFSIAISTAIFPRLSFLAAKGKKKELKNTVSLGIRMVFFLLIPSSLGLILIGKDIISLLFEHGAFILRDTLITTQSLFYYCPGLFAMGAVMILTRAFYSLQDVLIPLKTSIFTVCLNILLNFLLIGPLKHKGLALATSLSMLANMSVLFFLLREKLGDVRGREILYSLGKILAATAGMGAGIYILSFTFSNFLKLNSLINQILRVGVIVAAGVGIFGGLSYLMKLKEFKLVTESLKKD